MNVFTLPDPGEGLLEAEIVAWKVAVGDTVAVNDILAEIETAKSLVELPSPYAGVVAELLVPEGATVEVGTPIIRIGAPGEAVDPVDATLSVEPVSLEPTAPPLEPAATPATATDAASGAMLVGYGAKAGSVHRRPRRAGAGLPPAAGEPTPPAAAAVPAPATAPGAPPRRRGPCHTCAGWPGTSGSTSPRSFRPARPAPSPPPTCWRPRCPGPVPGAAER